MPGPKMPRPSNDSAASTIAMASSIVGAVPPKPAVNWLNRVDNSDWIPPAILFLAAHKGNSTYVLWFFNRLERLAAYLHISAKNVNERIERYTEVIKGLEQPHSLENPVASLELTNQEKEEMRHVLDGDIYLVLIYK